MEQSYSAWADWLNKFHTAPEIIQILWLTTMPVTILGAIYFVVRTARDITMALVRRGTLQAHLFYGIYRTMDGQWLVYAHGTITKLTLPDCPEPTIAFEKTEH